LKYRPKQTANANATQKETATETETAAETETSLRVRAALASLSERHRDDDVHPLDLKGPPQCTRRFRAMIWAAASGHFYAQILSSAHFLKKIGLARMALSKNTEFDIGALFKQFSNFSVALEWRNAATVTEKKEAELLTFKDVLTIRSFRTELNHCDALWKFIFFEHKHLFWSMAIYYALLKTTTVEEWDKMFEKQFALIAKYGKQKYIHEDVEAMELKEQEKDTAVDAK